MSPTETIQHVLEAVDAWEATWGRFERHAATTVEPETLAHALTDYTERLRGNYPFFHPRYAGQMLKPPHPAAVAAYLAAMRINPNNHALDGGPPTGAMEKEVVRELATRLFRLPAETLGHLTSSGTIANLEALFVARELRPERAIAFSEQAHYTHGRMAGVLRVPTVKLPTDERGALRLDALEDVLRVGNVGTVVCTAGTTGLGTIDPIEEVRALCDRYDARLHVDAAYGGFFTLLAWDDADDLLGTDARRHLRAIARADSVVVDPHKHGLQPYGCGCVLFRDPGVGRFYQHDSPYTYFTSDELHLGEISLECSRAGAAAGALWLTLRVLPLEAEHGLGPILAACRRAALRWHELLGTSDVLQPCSTPELDIVTFRPQLEDASRETIDVASQRLFDGAMNDGDDPIFLSLLRVEARRAGLKEEGDVRVLRSTLMKPEHEAYVDHLHQRVEMIARNVVPA